MWRSLRRTALATRFTKVVPIHSIFSAKFSAYKSYYELPPYLPKDLQKQLYGKHEKPSDLYADTEVGRLKRAFDTKVEEGEPVTITECDNLIRAYGRAGEFDRMIDFYQLVWRYHVRPDATTIEALIDIFSEHHKLDQATSKWIEEEIDKNSKILKRQSSSQTKCNRFETTALALSYNLHSITQQKKTLNIEQLHHIVPCARPICHAWIRNALREKSIDECWHLYETMKHARAGHYAPVADSTTLVLMLSAIRNAKDLSTVYNECVELYQCRVDEKVVKALTEAVLKCENMPSEAKTVLASSSSPAESIVRLLVTLLKQLEGAKEDTTVARQTIRNALQKFGANELSEKDLKKIVLGTLAKYAHSWTAAKVDTPND